ncbi:glycosyltransferase family 2 protein [Formosa sp. 3Alg 14/1]|uniref:glycosyltransferase family 2 protein n=1 Tax=Formosa sp. 3Alg 14/1 TaxID=3382190 RepID=UPI0039BDBE13
MSKKQSCNVSIVSANFNNGKYLDEFLASVINSSILPKELIIIDDGSTDKSLETLSKYNLDYLKVIALKTNVGFANALNIGIENTTSKYILRVDPDDVLEETRIETQYKLLESNNDIDLTGSNVVYFNEEIDNVVGASNFPEKWDAIYKRYLKGEHGLLHGTVMGKTVLFKQHLYRQDNVPAEDYDIFSRMIKHGAKAQSVKDKLTFVRIHQNSVSNALPYSTIKKTYVLRDKIFQTKTSGIKIGVNFISLKFYRKYYFEKNIFKRMCFLGISSVFRPDKVFKKLF